MRVHFTHHIDDLASDLAAMPRKVKSKAPGVVRKNVKAGNRLAVNFARARSGPHGLNYFKRLSWEMTGPLQGEYGPHDGGTPVGAGFRHAGVNMDLPDSADLIGPKFEHDVDHLIDGLFW
jgi:hypothetical protein